MAMRRTVPVLLALLLGCGTGTPLQPDSVTLVGRWNLQTVNGQSLPYTDPQISAYKFETLSHTVTMDSRGFYKAQGHYRLTSNGHATVRVDTDSGTYSVNPPQLTISSMVTGERDIGTISGTTLTFIVPHYTFVFSRQ
ncbi:MAG TPA: hypothetical protein VLN49_12900 [Gemmatimonadaceae bacterium]|nr:hypothetical protein [Gemmatimonadaceae bacterium]